MSDTKVTLQEKLAAIDTNIRELWDELPEDEQKTLKNELFILNRYVSNVAARGKNPTYDQQAHYVITVNEYFNKHFFTIAKHPKLQWLLLCMCNYDGKTMFFHQWLNFKKVKTSNKKYTPI